jgi:5-formyltetrahydrofolate cyclo-ligase
MKAELRKELLSLRDSKTREFLHGKSLEIRKQLFSMPEFQKARKILFYVSFGSEVETLQTIREAIKMGKVVAVPSTDKKKHTMVASQVVDLDKELEEGSYGIPEPKKEFIRELPVEGFDMVVVPAVAFDKGGYRIGYGGGYYDRFLLKTNALKVGLAFDFQVVDSLPREEHDLPVDKIVTENHILEF